MSDTDVTRIIAGSDRPWIPMPRYEGSFIKVLVADEDRGQVVFMFKMAPGAVFPRHRHHCHAVAYTTAGEWRYEEGKLPVGFMAYEPVGSEHSPASDRGAEMLVVLKSDTHRFLENFLDDQDATFEMDMNFFKLMQEITPEQASQIKIPGLA